MNPPSPIHRSFSRVAMIGAGGIGCHLGPMLAILFDLTLVDGDTYEPKNNSRQFPALKSTENKAQVLASILQAQTVQDVQFVPEYLKGVEIINKDAFKGVDLIIGAVDNNKSRRIIAELCDLLDIPAILGGNDELHGEAHLYWPGHYSCFEHFPFEDNEPAPFDCNADQTIEERPQTVFANIMAAGAVMQILLSLRAVENPKNVLCYTRHDTMGSEGSRVRNFDVIAHASGGG